MLQSNPRHEAKLPSSPTSNVPDQLQLYSRRNNPPGLKEQSQTPPHFSTKLPILELAPPQQTRALRGLGRWGSGWGERRRRVGVKGGRPTLTDTLKHLRITPLQTPTHPPYDLRFKLPQPPTQPRYSNCGIKFLLDADAVACFSELRGERKQPG